jgi:hypothetical protein
MAQKNKEGSPPTSDKEVAMKRFLALLGLVLVLLFSTAGMASAATLDFTSAPPYTGITLAKDPNNGQQNMQWSDVGGGHLYCNNSWYDSIISFTTPTFVSKFEMCGVRWEKDDPGAFGPMTIAAFDVHDGQVWSTVVDLTPKPPDYIPYTDWGVWLTVDVNTAGVSKLIFFGPNPGDSTGNNFYPSIDNLVINTDARVPIPASIWLLTSGLLGLMGLRRKFTR